MLLLLLGGRNSWFRELFGTGARTRAGKPLTLSQHAPLSLAFAAGDTQFMAHPLLEGYTRTLWQGAEYTALTAWDGLARLGGMDPDMPFLMAQNLGFCGELGALTLRRECVRGA